ncbi:hypothetical protein [Colwellia sp. 20A7]|uniref:hypothetical protein n=1 Tax=Colwellia sp. 20A7 TaxID=2689569 RepID=UPI001356D5A7|nr:hypothetical protein [Colwellia sp. 20A7]
MIVNFKSKVLAQLWREGNVALSGGFQIEEYKPNNWSVTVKANNIESIGSGTCLYAGGNAHDVYLNEYN